MHRSARSAAGGPTRIPESAILELWDRYYARGEFPLMHSAPPWTYGRARLSAFRNEDEWLTVFGVVVYHFGSGNFEMLLCAYGNRLRVIGVQDPPLNLRAQDAAQRGRLGNVVRRLLGQQTAPSPRESELLAQLSAHGIRFPPDPDLSTVDGSATFDDWWCVNPFDFQVVVCGAMRRFQSAQSDYARAGIDLAESISGEPHADRVIRAMRLLCDQLPPEELFYPPALLLECLGRPVSLPLFLQLDDWCHPGVGGVQRPSESPSLRSLAQALSRNRPDLYHCAPDMLNTHWTRWPRWLDAGASGRT